MRKKSVELENGPVCERELNDTVVMFDIWWCLIFVDIWFSLICMSMDMIHTRMHDTSQREKNKLLFPGRRSFDRVSLSSFDVISCVRKLKLFHPPSPSPPSPPKKNTLPSPPTPFPQPKISHQKKKQRPRPKNKKSSPTKTNNNQIKQPNWN